MFSTEEQRRIEILAAEKARRRMLAMRMYRPMETQLPFHKSRASERLIRGGVRGGKTACAVAEVASAALGVNITALDGTVIPNTYPKDRPLLIWIIGFDQTHIARMYRKLFRPGMFRIIKDDVTGLFRAWRPWEPADALRESDTKPCPPMIPASDVAEWAWDNKAERVFKVCRLKNGTEIHAFTSGGEAGQGEAVDLIWIDEDIQIPGHVEEWQSRLSDVRGRLIWSAWPHSKNEAIKRMTLRAADQRARVNPDVEEWLLAFSNNPYIPSDEKRKRLEGWAAAGEAVLRARDLGEYTDDFQLVYPNFNIDLQGVPRKSGPDTLEIELSKTQFIVPNDWTTYLAIDPGFTNAACIFGAVPPPSVGKFLLIYDEVLLQRCTAMDFAEEIAKKSKGRTFHAFIIDGHAGRMSVIGGGKRVVEFYREAFEKHNLHSRMTDTGFLPGSDNIPARNMVVRDWLNPRPDGTTVLRFITDAVPYTRREFSLYKQRITRDDVTEDVKSKDNHLQDSLAYLSAYLAPLFDIDQAYVPSVVIEDMSQPALRAYEKLTKPKTNQSTSFYMGAGVAPTAV